MCHEQRRQAQLAQEIVQLSADACARVRVERAHRLVEEEHARPARERAGEGDTLTLATREIARLRVREVRDPQSLEQAVGLAAGERHVALDREMREERIFLEHEPDRALLRTQIGAVPEPHVVATHNRPARRPRETGDRAQDRRLPCAGRTDERDRLRADVER